MTRFRPVSKPPPDSQIPFLSVESSQSNDSTATFHNSTTLIGSTQIDKTNIFDESLTQSQFDSRGDSRITYRVTTVEIFALGRGDCVSDPEKVNYSIIVNYSNITILIKKC